MITQICINLLASVSLITSWRHSRTDIIWHSEWLWEGERVCQTYDQTDRPTIIHSDSLSLSPPGVCCSPFAPPSSPSLLHFTSLLFLTASWGWPLRWAEALLRHSSAPSVKVMERGYQSKHLPFSSPPPERPGKEVRLEGLSCYPGLNKAELLAWWRTGCFSVNTSVKVLDWDRVQHRYQSSEYGAMMFSERPFYSDVLCLFNMVLVDFNSTFNARSSIWWQLHLSDWLWQMLGL